MDIKDILDKDKTPIFACIGTKKSFYDNTSNRIGDILKTFGFKVVFNFNNINMKDKLYELDDMMEETDNNQVIALDLSHSSLNKTSKAFYCYRDGISPGSALGRTHAPIGDVCIKICLNHFEDIKCDTDMLIAISKQSGNTKIHKTEIEIANIIHEFYNR